MKKPRNNHGPILVPCTPPQFNRSNNMKSTFAICGAAILLSAVTFRAGAEIIAGPITNPANGHDYYLLSLNCWTISETEAESLGGTLAVIDNAGEQEWVYSTFGSYGGVNRGGLWIGLHRTKPGARPNPWGYVSFTLPFEKVKIGKPGKRKAAGRPFQPKSHANSHAKTDGAKIHIPIPHPVDRWPEEERRMSDAPLSIVPL